MEPTYVLLRIDDPVEAARLIEDMRDYPDSPLLTPSQENTVQARLVDGDRSGRDAVTVRIASLAATQLNYDVSERACTVCGRTIATGDSGFAPTSGEWWSQPADQVVISRRWGPIHMSCFVAALISGRSIGPWLLLAEQLANAPSQFRPRDVKAIVSALLGIVADQLTGVSPAEMAKERPSS